MPDDPDDLPPDRHAARNAEQRGISVRHLVRAELGDVTGLDFGKAEDRETFAAQTRFFRSNEAVLKGLRPKEVEALGELIGLLPDGGIVRIKQALEMARTVSTLGRFAKWALLSIAAVFMAVATIGNGLAPILAWLRQEAGDMCFRHERPYVCIACVVVTLLLCAGSAWLSWAVFVDRTSPVRSLQLAVRSRDVIRPGGQAEIAVSVDYGRLCRTHVERALYDSMGQRYAMAELILAPAPRLGVQHSVTPFILAESFAPGRGRYVSHVSYACNWFQRWFWPISVPERTAEFDVAAAEDAPQ